MKLARVGDDYRVTDATPDADFLLSRMPAPSGRTLGRNAAWAINRGNGCWTVSRAAARALRSLA